MKRFEEKVALVTGGRSGIGKAIARRLRHEGATVYTAQRGPDEEFDGIPSDFSDPTCPDRIIAEVIDRAGKLDVLVNNAGVMQEATAEAMSLEDWQRSLAVNLTAPFLLIRAALPHLRKTRRSIVNTGSIEGLGANPGHAAYCASKAGLHGLTRAVAVDHGHEGIRCNAVAPGWIDTELNQPESLRDLDRPRSFRDDLRASAAPRACGAGRPGACPVAAAPPGGGPGGMISRSARFPTRRVGFRAKSLIMASIGRGSRVMGRAAIAKRSRSDAKRA